MRWQKVRLWCLACVPTPPGAVILRLRRLFLSSSSEKPIHLRPWARLGGTRVVPWLAVAMRRRLNALPILSAAGSGCFECAVLRRSIPNERGKFHLALDQVRCFKSSVEHQSPRVPPDVADHEFHRARESDRVCFAPTPLCIRRRSAPQTLVLGSSSSNLPFPSPCASKRRERWSSFAKVISTFHLPIRFGDCAWAMTTVWRINMRIKARFAVILFRNPDSVLGQGFREFRIH